MIEQKTLDSFNGDSLASSTFIQKYALRDADDNLIEFTMFDLKKRLVNAILKCEQENFNKTEIELNDLRIAYERLFNNFMCGGRISYALGNERDTTATYSNCYVTAIHEDSIEGIYQTCANQARVFSRGGGIGFDISNLRPAGAPVNNSAKTTSGAVSFMDLFSLTTGIIGQYGRRAALMLTMSIDYPDIEEFIKIKGGLDKTKVQYANISVRITDDFMRAVERNDNWLTKFLLKDDTYFTKEYRAIDLWNLIVESNYNGAEPGLLYWDVIIDNEPCNVFNELKVISTNPCGELPLSKGGACVLGSINLSSLVKNYFDETKTPEFDFDEFEHCIKYGVRFLDNIIELNLDRQPLEENKIMAEKSRKIGLGITGLADCLIKMNIKYDTQESIDFLNTIFKFLKEESVKYSIDLAEERGSFPVLKQCTPEELTNFVTHKYFDFLLNTVYYDKFIKHGVRNCGWTTIAPNGSLSIILQTSSGIEPIFNTEYNRTKINSDGNKEIFVVYHPLVKEYESKTKKSYKDNINFITAEKIDWKQRVKIQSTLQKYISASISSTINLPKETTKETISNIYMEAWKNNLKGITIFRDGSREGVLNKIETDYKEMPIIDHVKFPEYTDAKMRVIKSENRKWYVTYTIDNETKLPNSLFVNTNSSETNITTTGVLDELRKLAKEKILDQFIVELDNKIGHQPNVVKTARYLSLLLRHRISIMDIIKSIELINIPVNSFAYRIKGLLAEFIEGKVTDDDCPECKSKMIYEGGCKICKDCGYSKCG